MLAAFLFLTTLLLTGIDCVVPPEQFYGSDILLRSQCRNVTKYVSNFTLNDTVGTLKLKGQGSAVTTSLHHTTKDQAAGT